jgi:CheY-like chemotaxis protein
MSHELRTPMNVHHGHDQPGRAAHHRSAPDGTSSTKVDQPRATFARRHQRHPRHFQDRSRATEPGAGRLHAGRRAEQPVGADRAQGRGKGPRPAHRRDTPEDARRQLKGDPLRLGQILLNLAGNAVKFTDAGSITLRVRVEELSGEELRLRVDVQDTGIGIAAEDQKRLFTAFEQADGSMTRKYGGTGLGLAISRRLARMMGGDIDVTSRPGAGSTFRLRVRLRKATGAVAPAPTSGPGTTEARLEAEFGGTRILLAEDEPTNRDVARWLLEDRGLVVDLAEDGMQAVDLAGQTSYALILMDMQMPNLNGVDATRAIRALPGHGRTPILAMTANAFAEDRQVCLDAGMDDHIGKPVAAEVLYETILKWLSMPRP